MCETYKITLRTKDNTKPDQSARSKILKIIGIATTSKDSNLKEEWSKFIAMRGIHELEGFWKDEQNKTANLV